MDDPAPLPPRVRVLPRRRDLCEVLDPTDRLLASFPRSGNTWLRFILADLMVEGRAPYPTDISDLNRITFDVYKGLGKPRFLPFRIVKIHDRHPGTDHRFVTIVRNPADSIVSYFHYNQMRGRDEHIRAGVDAFTADLIPAWVDHVQTYIDALDDGKAGILATYEDLHADPFPVISEICRFLGVAAGPSQIGAAIDRRSFSNLQKLEAGGPMIEKETDPQDTSERFFRKGIIGSGEEELSDSTMELLAATALPVYEDANRRAVRQSRHE